MIVSIPLQPDTLLANVRYRFIVGVTEGDELNTNISQPDTAFPIFLFNVDLPDGITDVVAYDTTDVDNWNVAGLGAGAGIAPPAPAPIGTTRLIAMSTPFRVSFRRVFNGVVRLLGLNPKARLSEDDASSVLEHINSRVQTIALAWPWPEWSATEERAYRQVWNASRQFYRVNELGVPDEVFYITTLDYWKVNPLSPADPLVGIPPSDTNTDWLRIDPLDRYIAYNQVCRRTIGQILGVYQSDPRAGNGCGCGNSSNLCYRPSEHGIDIRGTSLPTVFIHYQMPTPEYTMTPFIQGRTYVRGDVIFDNVTGECFQALDTTTNAPADDLTIWRHVPFLSKWYDFVRWGAYADALLQIDQGGTIDPNLATIRNQKAESNADQALEQEIDSLRVQGQKLQYNFCKPKCDWCETLNWTGGNVTTITDECQDSTGWVFPVPPTPIGIHWEWHPEIASLRGPSLPSLAGFPTLTWAPYSKIEIAIDPGTGLENQEWRLRSGEADELDPGQVVPDDFDTATNNKHWELIGA